MTATEYTIEIAISLEQNSELNLIELARLEFCTFSSVSSQRRRLEPGQRGSRRGFLGAACGPA